MNRDGATRAGSAGSGGDDPTDSMEAAMIDSMGMDWRTRGSDPQSQAASPKSQPQMAPPMEQVRE